MNCTTNIIIFTKKYINLIQCIRCAPIDKTETLFFLHIFSSLFFILLWEFLTHIKTTKLFFSFLINVKKKQNILFFHHHRLFSFLYLCIYIFSLTRVSWDNIQSFILEVNSVLRRRIWRSVEILNFFFFFF